MKNFYLSFAFCLISILTFANGETVVVLTNTGDGIAETPTELKPVTPCATLLFKVNVYLPQGYVIVGKYEWFVNGVSVFITTDPSDPILQWAIKSNTTSVYCKVTYKKQDGTSSSPSSSTTFTPIVKDLDFFTIYTSNVAPNYGCISSVSYSLPETPCSNLCDFTYNVNGGYSIAWQAPTGWVQTSLTNKGSNVSFTPDAVSSGTLIATITLPCGYSETRIFAITRGAEVPTFTTNYIRACSPSSIVSINPTCGAIDYTYSIEGNPGITFSNGQQTFRTASTSVSINIPSGSSVNTLKVKANYPNAVSSSDISNTLYVGAQKPTSIQGFYENGKQFAPNTIYSFSSTGTEWDIGGGTIISGQGTQIITVLTDPRPAGMPNLSFYMSVRETAPCGNSDWLSRSGWVVAGGSGGAQIITSPNPSSSSINVSFANSNTFLQSEQDVKSQSIYKIRIADFMGNTKKLVNYKSGVRSTNISLSGIKPGTYTLSVFDGNSWSSQQIVVQ